MAKIKIEAVVDHLDTDFKNALEQAVKRAIPNTPFDKNKLFREFKSAIYHKCSTWETVPDQYVEKD